MSKVNLNVHPYWDDYDRSKKYTQLVAIPGRNAQAREFTQMQTILKDIIKSVGDSILQDGDIIEGCQIIAGDKKVIVSAGKVYMDGMVSEVEETEIAILGVGTEYICVDIEEEIISENEDPSLRDLAQGYANYDRPGCYRVRRRLKVFKGTAESSAILAMLVDGELAVENYAPEYDTLTQTLARRTYDESGSYIVEGLKVRVEDIPDDNNNFYIVVEPGKAYILGYEIKIPNARRLILPRSTTHKSVERSYRYTSSEQLLSSDPYIKEIVSVLGERTITDSLTLSSNNGRSQLSQSGSISVTSVNQGDTVYTVGSSPSNGDCYVVTSGDINYLQWNGTNNYPSGSYTCTYVYNKTFKNGTDYELDTRGEEQYINWLDSDASDHPDDNGDYDIIYQYYLARKDIVYIDQLGNIQPVTGNPNNYGFEVSPKAPLNTLPLAIVTSPPNSNASSMTASTRIQASNVGLTRFTMNDIQYLLNRIRTLEYDQAVLSLNNEAIQTSTVSSKKGVLTDPFIDLSRADIYFNRNSSGEPVSSTIPVYDAAIDLLSNICYLPVSSKIFDLTIEESNTTAHIGARILSLPITGESVVLSQSKATKAHPINPYSVFPQTPEISISPEMDNWIEESVVTIPVSLQDSTIVRTSTRFVDAGVVNVDSSFNGISSTTENSSSLTQIGARTESSVSESLIGTEAITYIREHTITVEGSDFYPNTEIVCHFDDRLMGLIALDGTQQGAAGSVFSNNEGYFKAQFTIPGGTFFTGIRTVTCSHKENVPIHNVVNIAYALYQASGTRRNIERTVTTLTTLLYERINTTTTTTVNHIAPSTVDPVGQTFVLDRLTTVSGIEVYFQRKPTSSNTPVHCEIRGVENGNITPTVYGRKSLHASEVSVSDTSSVATRFTFDDPILVEGNKEYAIVLRSTSDEYNVWTAELGGDDRVTGEKVSKNPYLVGVMMSSSNNSSWTSHPTTDLKFNVIANRYASSGTVNYSTINAMEIARIYMSADFDTPVSTDIKWYYQLDGENEPWHEISPYNLVYLGYLKNDIKVRAELSRGDNDLLSPFILINSVGVRTSHFEPHGYYIMKEIDGLDPYSNVSIVLDVLRTSGTDIKIYISPDRGNTMIEAAVVESSARLLNYNWVEYTYEAKLDSPETKCQVFVEMTSDNKYSTPAIRRLRAIMS